MSVDRRGVSLESCTDGDEIAVVEAVYRVGGSDADWLSGLARTAAPLLNRGFGVAAFTARLTDGQLRVLTISSFGGPDNLASAVEAFTSSADPAMMAKAFSAGPCTTMAAASGGFDKLKGDPASEAMFRVGINDALGVMGSDGTPFFTGLSSFLPHATVLSKQFKTRWARVATHLAAGFRIRRALAELGSLSSNADISLGAEAIMNPSGALMHAEGPAQKARASLARAVVAMDRARSRLRREEPDTAIEAWKGLVKGRWSLIERFDSDGRRFLVARKNDPDSMGPSALSLQERQVLAGRVRGLSIKLISYDLGRSLSAVSKDLQSGMAKLGVTHESELVSLLTKSAGAS